MGNFAVILLFTTLFAGCQVSQNPTNQQSNANDHAAAKKYSQVKLKVDYEVSTVGISEYTLITDDLEARRKDAEEIMRIKKNLPLAMQTKERAFFDRILAKNFIFRASYEFFNREDYIEDRVTSPVTVETAEYENLVLQCFGDTAVLTYRNIVKGNDDKGKPETWRYNWADVFVKENGEWKIGAVYEIEDRKE
ncbi:MAG: nuclear transport factor 2 family protein [Pyrinomonadaceae bacterium]